MLVTILVVLASILFNDVQNLIMMVAIVWYMLSVPFSLRFASMWELDSKSTACLVVSRLVFVLAALLILTGNVVLGSLSWLLAIAVDRWFVIYIDLSPYEIGQTWVLGFIEDMTNEDGLA